MNSKLNNKLSPWLYFIFCIVYFIFCFVCNTRLRQKPRLSAVFDYSKHSIPPRKIEFIFLGCFSSFDIRLSLFNITVTLKTYMANLRLTPKR